LHGVQGLAETGREGGKHHHDFAQVRGQQEVHRLAHIMVNRPAMADRDDQALEVVVFQDHIGHLTRHIGTRIAHGNADVSGFEGRPVVDAIARHGHDLASTLQRLHNL